MYPKYIHAGSFDRLSHILLIKPEQGCSAIIAALGHWVKLN